MEFNGCMIFSESTTTSKLMLGKLHLEYGKYSDTNRYFGHLHLDRQEVCEPEVEVTFSLGSFSFQF